MKNMQQIVLKSLTIDAKTADIWLINLNEMHFFDFFLGSVNGLS